MPNHYEPWSSAYQDFSSFVAVGILLSVLFLLGKPKITGPLGYFFILPFIPIAQFFLGLEYFAGDAWVVAIYLAGFVLMLLAGYNFSRIFGQAYFSGILAGTFVLGAVLSCWIALRQWLSISGSIWIADLPLGERPYANFGQPNSLATLLCLGLAGVLFFYEKRRLNNLSSWLLIGFLLIGVALTQSRTPWVCSVALVFFWAWKSRTYPVRLSLPALFACIGFYVFLILALPKLSDWIMHADSEAFAQLIVRAQSLERWGIWTQLWHAVWQGPLWGYGWNQVGVAQLGVSLAYPLPIYAEHSHNILLDLLLWNGPVLGLAIILCIGVWLFRLGWHARSVESLFALLASGFLLIHGMLEFPLEYAFFLLPLGLLLGVAAAEHPPVREFEVPRWLLGVVLFLSVGLFGWIWVEYRIIEEDHRLMRFETARIGTLKAEKAAPDIIVLTQLRELIRLARTPATENMSEEQLSWMRKVAYRYPFPPSLFRYALALGLNGQPDAAVLQLLILRNLHGFSYFQKDRVALQGMVQDYPQLADVLRKLPSGSE